MKITIFSTLFALTFLALTNGNPLLTSDLTSDQTSDLTTKSTVPGTAGITYHLPDGRNLTRSSSSIPFYGAVYADPNFTGEFYDLIAEEGECKQISGYLAGRATSLYVLKTAICVFQRITCNDSPLDSMVIDAASINDNAYRYNLSQQDEWSNGDNWDDTIWSFFCWQPILVQDPGR